MLKTGNSDAFFREKRLTKNKGHKTHDSQKPWLVYDCRPRAQSVRSRDVVSNRDIEETVDEEQARQLI